MTSERRQQRPANGSSGSGISSQLQRQNPFRWLFVPPQAPDQDPCQRNAGRNEKDEWYHNRGKLSMITIILYCVLCMSSSSLMSATRLTSRAVAVSNVAEQGLVAAAVDESKTALVLAEDSEKVVVASRQPTSEHTNTGTMVNNRINDGRASTATRRHSLKIAIVSGYVTPQRQENEQKRLRRRQRLLAAKQQEQRLMNESLLDHMVNKACYADIHGYDWIFNTTWGFPECCNSTSTVNSNQSNKTNPWWLKHGTWHRVPHIQAALPKYDWVVYADTDWVVQDMTLPLESFLLDFALHNQNAASVFVPIEYNPILAFSAYAVMIRNNPFGRRVVENWMHFATHGVCPKGNFPDSTPAQYQWFDSDQPGLWWALAQTHAEFTNNTFHEFQCDSRTGFITTPRWLGPEMRNYFKRVGYISGAEGDDLEQIAPNQYIIWSRVHRTLRSGLGYQATFGALEHTDWERAFAKHTKRELNPRMKRHLQYCRTVRGCDAYYEDDNVLHVGCNASSSTVGNSNMREG